MTRTDCVDAMFWKNSAKKFGRLPGAATMIGHCAMLNILVT